MNNKYILDKVYSIMIWFDISKVLLLAFACTVVTEKNPSSDQRNVMSEK